MAESTKRHDKSSIRVYLDEDGSDGYGQGFWSYEVRVDRPDGTSFGAGGGGCNSQEDARKAARFRLGNLRETMWWGWLGFGVALVVTSILYAVLHALRTAEQPHTGK